MNLTPLIDVVFLLLVFFMLASTFLKFGTLKLETAGGGVAAVADPAKVVLVHVGAGGRILIDGRPVGRGEIAGVLAGIHGQGRSDAVVVVREGARTMDLADALSILKRQAFASVRVVE